MPSIEYESIYKRALSRLNDVSLSQYAKEDFYEALKEWLSSASSDPYLQRKFTKYVDDEDMEEIQFELENSVNEQYDINFVTNMLAQGLIVNYMPSKLEQASFLHAMVYGKEEKWKDNYKNAQMRLDTLTAKYYRELSQHGYYFGKKGE